MRVVEIATSQRREMIRIIELDAERVDKAWQSDSTPLSILHALKNPSILADIASIETRPTKTIGIEEDKDRFRILLAPSHQIILKCVR